MKLIVITSPDFIEDESTLIRAMLDLGVDYVHIRKPQASSDAVGTLIEKIGPEYYQKLAIHYHHDIAVRYNIGGIHISSQHRSIPSTWEGRISESCHTFSEVVDSKANYCFLSPIFDSISKKGYRSSFTEESLKNASERGIISKRVIALGGVRPNDISFLSSLNFGGVAILGGIWNSENAVQAALSYIKMLK